jgi:hypothetical protein
LLIHDPEEKASVMLRKNIRTTLEFAGIGLEEMRACDVAGLTSEKLSYSAIILASENASEWLFPDDARAFVERGGTLYVAMRSWAPDFFYSFGIVASEGLFLDTRGLMATKPFFASFSAGISEKVFISNALPMQVSPEWETLIQYRNPATMPLLLERSFGRGRIVYWNGTCMHQKEFRGLLLFSLLRNLPVGAMSMFNVLAFQIDDSPPPAFGLKTGVIHKDLGVDDFTFYRKFWYPRIMALLDEKGLKPSHYFTFNYYDQVKGPFSRVHDREAFFKEIIGLIRAHKHELGIHGFNHQSLTLGSGPSRPWPGVEEMRNSVARAFDLWNQEGWPPSLTYVAPNNVIDPSGKKALADGFPTVRGIGRLYVGGDDYSVEGFGDAEAGDEYGIDPDQPVFVNFPRMSSGFYLHENNLFEILNGIMAHGAVNHFIHPDDIYDPERARSNWEKMVLELNRLVIFFQKALPTGQPLFASQFIQQLKRYYTDTITIEAGENTLIMRCPRLGRRFFYVFSRQAAMPKITNGTLLHTLEPGRLFVIEMTQDPCTITFQPDE